MNMPFLREHNHTILSTYNANVFKFQLQKAVNNKATSKKNIQDIKYINTYTILTYAPL
jgi:hypothetical protein